MKIISIVGARPQFIKLGPLSAELRKNAIDEKIIHTGQHYDKQMSELIFQDLMIPEPDYNLGIGSGKHGKQTGQMLMGIEEILITENPDFVIVFGDTNTTLAGVIAAAKLRIRVIHVEAGLRSFNRSMPEELNRVAADHLSDYLFAPTEIAMANLNRENLAEKSYKTGDIMVDALRKNMKIALAKSDIDRVLKLPDDFYLLTLHRPYNVDNPVNLSMILNKLGSLNIKIIFPCHPRTKMIISSQGIKIPENFCLSEPLGYFDFLKTQNMASKIITDSGGVQKEAYLNKTPCITIRTETEWTETIDAGWNILIQPEDEDFSEIIKNFNPVGEFRNLYGNNVAKDMTNLILSFHTE